MMVLMLQLTAWMAIASCLPILTSNGFQLQLQVQRHTASVPRRIHGSPRFFLLQERPTSSGSLVRRFRSTPSDICNVGFAGEAPVATAAAVANLLDRPPTVTPTRTLNSTEALPLWNSTTFALRFLEKGPEASIPLRLSTTFDIVATVHTPPTAVAILPPTTANEEYRRGLWTIGFCTLVFASLSPAMHAALSSSSSSNALACPVILLNAAVSVVACATLTLAGPRLEALIPPPSTLLAQQQQQQKQPNQVSWNWDCGSFWYVIAFFAFDHSLNQSGACLDGSLMEVGVGRPNILHADPGVSTCGNLLNQTHTKNHHMLCHYH